MFEPRHIGPNSEQQQEMLDALELSSLDALIDQTVPKQIRLDKELNLRDAISEAEYLEELRSLFSQNKLYKSYIGLGYYNCHVPPVIQRNILENPGWYTQYTPYQAEISQGRLEALLNFQTMICDLTQMDIANASLLDEATAAAEAMALLHRVRPRDKQTANTYLVSEDIFPKTLDILMTRAEPLGIKIQPFSHTPSEYSDEVFGVMFQMPGKNGHIRDYQSLIETAKQKECLVSVAADLMSLILLEGPGKWDADVVVGTAQRFGVPMGFGGPHAAYIACKETYKRHLPGRIIGVSKDKHENLAYRMSLQTREQHIRREKATSNICTAQALLAIMSSMYAVYHGPSGLQAIAQKIHKLTLTLKSMLQQLNFSVSTDVFFDTLCIETGHQKHTILEKAASLGLNFRQEGDTELVISLDETTSLTDLESIIQCFGNGSLPEPSIMEEFSYPDSLRRSSTFLRQPIFNTYHSETEMMRYIKRLENKDLSLTSSMIPLGSCTMKLNSAAEMLPITWPEIASIHPYVPVSQVPGYMQMISELETDLASITEFDGCSLQPNSGAQGEYAGLMAIRAFHAANGESGRRIVLIPKSAHGTNPATASMAGMDIVLVDCDEDGNIILEDIKSKTETYKDKLAALMVTYPSTHGVFEEEIKEICTLVHQVGGQVYMDGANLNAQVGLTSPRRIGADVCHINLHKTFSIPHGGGGPGMGPICVAEHLIPFLPGSQSVPAISQAPWGSASILTISYGYIKMLGKKGVTQSSKVAILNANYIKHRLAPYYPVLYVGKQGRVAHELIIDCRPFKKEANIDVEDIAKRLIDYGYHAPTMSFPVAGTLMIEPTESENKEEIDRFCEAMISIKSEIDEIVNRIASEESNVLKNAPHSIHTLSADEWPYPYSRQKAAYPLPYLKTRKFWSPVSRIDNAYGDRNLLCTCPPIEVYGVSK